MVVFFLDDLLVYSKNIEDHKKHLRHLFEILRENKPCAKCAKCTIASSEVNFLGHRVNAEGVYMQTRLMDAILNWPALKSILSSF